MHIMFIGREKELQSLRQSFLGDKAHLSVIYGRRRVGKSSLVTEAARGVRFFAFEGLENQPKQKQINAFIFQLEEFGADTRKLKDSPDWLHVFALLKDLASKRYPTVILLDELQWLANYRSELISCLKLIWEQKLSKLNIKLVLCGSVASFMLKKVIKSKALYGRSDLVIHLEPFLLNDTKKLLNNRGKDEILLAQCLYGGVPKYLTLLNDRSSILESLQFHTFSKDGYFLTEYDKIFISHFGKNPNYERTIRFLAGKKYGAGRKEIVEHLKVDNSGELSRILENLELAGFIAGIVPFDKKNNSVLKRYFLADNYISFYLNFIEPRKKQNQIDNTDFINNIYSSAQFKSWLGISFELLCYHHRHLIARKLGFGQIEYTAGPYFRHNKNSKLKGVQVDLIFYRKDKVFVVCEIKYQEKTIGISILNELAEKIAKIPELENKTVQKVLISAGKVSAEVENSPGLNAILTADDLLG